MKTPSRWLDDPALAADLRADLECVQRHAWTPDLVRAAEALDAALAAEPSPAPEQIPSDVTQLSAAGGVAQGSLLLKLALAAVGCGMLVAAGSWQLRASRPTLQPAPSVAPRRAAAPALSPEQAVATPSAAESGAPAKPAPGVGAPALLERAAPLRPAASRREIEQLQRIHATLERDPAEAYRLARASLKEIPRGPLREEREGLAVIALWQSGGHAAARARAQRFLASYPQSPLQERILALLASEPAP